LIFEFTGRFLVTGHAIQKGRNKIIESGSVVELSCHGCLDYEGAFVNARIEATFLENRLPCVNVQRIANRNRFMDHLFATDVARRASQAKASGQWPGRPGAPHSANANQCPLDPT
jgi:hypothetical protein